MRLLLATNNPGKVEKIKVGLEGIPWPIVTSEEIGLGRVDVAETGKTLEENARLKARGFFDAVKRADLHDVAVFADDGGMEIDALNGEPGILARRWAGEGATDEQIIAYTLKRMEGIPTEKRTARFRVNQVLIFPDGREETMAGTTEGRISGVVRKNKIHGLPYSGILIVTPYEKPLDDLTPEELTTTHRVRALGQIRAIIMQNTAKYA